MNDARAFPGYPADDQLRFCFWLFGKAQSGSASSRDFWESEIVAILEGEKARRAAAIRAQANKEQA